MSAKKKKIVIAFAVIAAALLLLGALYFILGGALGLLTPAEPEYEFYIPSEDEDYYNDPKYLNMDRVLRYTDATGQQWFIDDDSTCEEIGAVFFRMYFMALEYGDAEALNSMYSEELAVFEDFTPQRTYRKEVKYLYDSKVDDQTYSITYSLDYNIMKNDGSFRRDIGSDMSRTQYITLYYNSEKTWIEDIKTEYRK